MMMVTQRKWHQQKLHIIESFVGISWHWKCKEYNVGADPNFWRNKTIFPSHRKGNAPQTTLFFFFNLVNILLTKKMDGAFLSKKAGEDRSGECGWGIFFFKLLLFYFIFFYFTILIGFTENTLIIKISNVWNYSA